MSKLIMGLLVSTAISGCASLSDFGGKPPVPVIPLPSANVASSPGAMVSPVLEFVSVDPATSPWFEKETQSGVKKVFWEDLKNSEANPELPLERSFVSIKRVTGDGSLGFASTKFSAEAGKYRTIIDYAKYRDEVMGPNNIPCKVGVGVRIVADIVTTKANVDLGSLFAIAFAAKSGYLGGQIEVIKIGIDSPALSLILPPPTEINDTSLQNAMQAVAAIRAKMYDDETKIRPHVIAVKYLK